MTADIVIRALISIETYLSNKDFSIKDRTAIQRHVYSVFWLDRFIVFINLACGVKAC